MTETERLLAEFWVEVLEIDAVEPDLGLLELGGNSLLATMVANRIELSWGFRPSLGELLSCSFRELALLCDKLRAEHAGAAPSASARHDALAGADG